MTTTYFLIGFVIGAVLSYILQRLCKKSVATKVSIFKQTIESIKPTDKVNERKEMDTTNLVMGERARTILRFSDANNNARKVENPVVTADPAKTQVELVATREWQSTDPVTGEVSIGTEVEALATPLAEGDDTVTVSGDPLPGEPEAIVSIPYSLHTSSAATGGAVFSTVIEAIPQP